MLYPWLKVGHLTFVIFWMAGLFMLPRLFVYHQETPVGAPENAQWVSRERKLLNIILWPSLIATWGFGIGLALDIGAFQQGWFHAKLALVAILTAYHFWLAAYAGSLARGERKWSGKRLRMVNEVPGIMTILIVILVLVKPF